MNYVSNNYIWRNVIKNNFCAVSNQTKKMMFDRERKQKKRG